MVPTKCCRGLHVDGGCLRTLLSLLLILMVLEIRTEADNEGRLQNEIAPVQNNLYNHS